MSGENDGKDEKVDEPEGTIEEKDENISKEEYEAKEAELVQAKAELEKLKNKDYNFRALEEKKDRETEEKKKKLSSKAKEIKRIEDDLITRQRKWEEAQLSEANEASMLELCGDDKDLRAKVELAKKDLSMSAYNKEDIREKNKKAYLLATGMSPQKSNPINAANIPTGSYRGKGGSKKYRDTQEGKDNYAKWFPKSPSVKKKDK
jgi:hypothetical protein|tara:strand:+ start:6177 stop:6791 length:615 start_codon:yes stop_codon:yes gene_type:complete